VLCRGIGWARRRERAEHFHAPAAARTGVEAAVLGLPGVVTVVGRYASRDGDQLAAKGEFLGTMTIAEKTVIKRLDPFVSRGLSRDEQYQKLERLFAEILCHSGPLASHPAAG
jgi:hypothetical protein